MSLDLTGAFADVLREQTKHFAQTWKVTREDGQVFSYTTHDRIIEYDGVEYTPVGGFSDSDRRVETALQDHSLDFVGAISADEITDDDLRAGLFSEAEVVESLIDWRAPWVGPFISRRYWVVRATFNDVLWSVELSGSSRFLRAAVGDTFTRNCTHTLGVTGVDGYGCTVAVSTTTGVAVLGTLDGDKRLIIRADPTDLNGGSDGNDDHYNFGEVTFTSGANNGITGEIKDYAGTNRDITMYQPFPYPIEVGDEFTIKVGCDKTKSTCVSKFNNLPEFRGYPYLPGSDRVLTTPRAR